MHSAHSLGILSQVDGIWVYLVIFLLIIVQEAGVPFPILPSEVVLLSAGFLNAEGKISGFIAGVLATGATLLGNSLLFFISRRYGRVALDRYGKYVHLRPDRIDRIEGWINRRGTPILLYGPLVPILRAYVPALAGLFGVPFSLYIMILLAAAALWSFGLIALGDLLGDHWYDGFSFIRHNMLIGILVACVIIACATLFLRWRRRVAEDRAQHWPETVVEPTVHPRAAAVRLPTTTTNLHAED